MGLGLALAACSGDPETADPAPSDADEAAQGSDADDDGQGSDADDDGQGSDADGADDAGQESGADDAAEGGGMADGDDATTEEADEQPSDGDGQTEPVTIDGCPVVSETVSDIVGSTLVAGDPRDTVGDGVSCAYLHETDLYPDAAVTIGNWDGSEEFRGDVVDTNAGLFGEPTDTPTGLGEAAFLWNPQGEQTTLIVFDAGRYYTTTVNGIDDTDQKRDMVVSLYEAAQ